MIGVVLKQRWLRNLQCVKCVAAPDSERGPWQEPAKEPELRYRHIILEIEPQRRLVDGRRCVVLLIVGGHVAVVAIS